MRGISRIGSVAALTAALALGASSNAFAVGADDQIFDLTAAVNPNHITGNELKGANLYVQTQWLDADNSPVVPAEGAEEIRLDFDDDISIQTKKLPKCNTDPAELAAESTNDAIADCGNAQVGAGAAKVRFAAFGGPPFNLPQSELNLTVTAFNGPTSTAGPADCADSNTGGPFNCEWVGGNPTLYLHAYNQATNQVSLVRGEIQDVGDNLPGAGTPAIGPGMNQRLAVTDGTDVAGDAGAVTLFNSVVGKKYSYQQNGKTVKANYLNAACNPDDDVDPASPGTQSGWQFSGNTVYDDDFTHSANADPSRDNDSIFVLCSNN